MNERIRELSDIAYKNHLARNPHSSFGRRSDYDRELAELIVGECARVASNQVMDVEGNDWGVRNAVEKHFGVEE